MATLGVASRGWRRGGTARRWRQQQAKREHAWSKVRLHEGKKQGSGESGVCFGDVAARR
jgi:hypothetical protein